jgi:hypothetical protein
MVTSSRNRLRSGVNFGVDSGVEGEECLVGGEGGVAAGSMFSLGAGDSPAERGSSRICISSESVHHVMVICTTTFHHRFPGPLRHVAYSSEGIQARKGNRDAKTDVVQHLV